MRYASIDIGTNTILMLVGEIDGGLSISRLNDFYEVPRVGKGVSVSKTLGHEAIMRGVNVLKKYREIALKYKVDRVVASATSAIRDAENRLEFVDLVREKCGMDVEVIDGATEARLGFMGAMSAVPDKIEPTLVIDIGGGSTELSFGTEMEPRYTKSLDIGAVRLTEKFFTSIPPNSDEVEKAIEYIREVAVLFPFSKARASRIFAVAGTATTIALIAQKKYEFDLDAVTNYEMSRDALRGVLDELRKMSPSQVRKTTAAAEGREDVLLAGALILFEILKASGAQTFMTTDRGLRYGYMIHKHRQLLAR
ncbi:MAG: Ppx/GppA family phosphatase [Bacteroidetes bacterium]|nr:Ppx/GppA family phosphatase [Bacteroidota bacterium]